MRFPDEEPDVDEWEEHWSDWADRVERFTPELCDYCGLQGHRITKCPVAIEERE